MRKKIFGIACAALCALGAGVSASVAQGPQIDEQCIALRERWRGADPVVVNLFNQFPRGVGLADAISQLLFNYPALAADIVFYAVASGNHAQQVATGIGIGRAVAAYTSLGNYAIAGQIARAVFCAGNRTVISNAVAASGGTISPNGDYNPPPPPQQVPPPHPGNPRQPPCPQTMSQTRPCNPN